MKKRIIAALACTIIVLNSFGAGKVVNAGENFEYADEISVEPAEVDEASDEIAVEETTAEEITEEETTEEETEITDEEKFDEVTGVSEDGIQDTIEETEEEEKTEEEEDGDNEDDEESEESFSESKVANGVRITLTADAGVLPEGATFTATAITTSSSVSSIKEAVEKELPESEKVTKVQAFDITILDADGNEIQPNNSKGSVKVSFANVDTSSDLEVYHVADSCDSAEKVNSSQTGSGVSFEAEHFSIYVVASIGETVDDTKVEGKDLVKSIVVKNGDKELKSGDAVSFSDSLSVTYSFKKNIVIASATDDYDANGNEDYYFLKQDETYELPSIDVTGLKDFTGLSTDIMFEDDETGEKTSVGKVSIASDGKVTITINSGVADNTQIAIDDFVVSFAIDKTEIGQATSYTLNIGTQTYKFTISDNVAEEPTIATAGTDNGDGTVSWTNTITNASVPVDYSDLGYTFVGVIDKNQILDESSIEIKVNGSAITVDSDKLSVVTNEDGATTITYVLDGSLVPTGADEKVVITYKSEVDFLSNGGAATAASSRTATNNVKIATSADAGESIATASGSATVAASKKIPALSKKINNAEGKFTKDTASDCGIGEWTITVNTNGYPVKNLIIYDYLVLGDTSGKFDYTFDETSLEVTKNGEATTAYTLVNEAGTNSDGKNYSWYVKFESAAADDEFVISYKTKVSNYTQYLRTNHTIAPNNTAFMTYEFEKGTGKWVQVVGPSMKVDSKITTNAGISVSTGTASVYDRATHQITWTVTVNKETESLTGTKILDQIPSNQTYVSSNIKDVVSTATITSDGSNVTFDIGNAADGKSITFKVVTKLTDDEISLWGKNQSKTYYNPFTLTATELGDDSLNITANCPCTSEVISLTASTYNYDTHEINYTIDVNDNKMLMDGVSVADDLGSLGLQLVEGTVEIDGNALSKEATSGPRYTYSDGKLTVYSDDVTSTEEGTSDAKATITFTAKVTDEKLLSASSNTENVTIKNTAELNYTAATSDNTSVSESSSASTSYTNNIILKDATVDKENLSADYVVTFNANQIELPTNVAIVDVLGKSMDLDVSSVKLYVGEVNSTTGAVTSTGELEEGYDVSTALNDAGQTVLTVKLPTRANNTHAYYLTYSASAVDFSANDYGNSVSVVGYTTAVISTTCVKANALATVKANATKLPKLVIKNVDANDNSLVLEGSTFVVKDSDGNVVRTMVTKSNGTATAIAGKIKNGQTYTVTQLIVKDGYVLESNPVEVTVSGNTGAVTVENEKLSTTVSIYSRKNTEDGELFDGSTMKLVKDGTEETTWDSAEVNPKEVKVYYGSKYVVSETVDEDNYNTGSNIVFEVVKDSDDKVYIKLITADGSADVEDGVINMVTTAKDRALVKISKVSAGQGNELEGATLSIEKYKDGKTVVEPWTTTGVAKEVSLPEGEYYLVEESAPYGYVVAEKIRFKIDSDLSLWIYEEDDYVKADTAKIVMTDAYVESVDEDGNDNSPKATVTFSPETLGIDPALFKEMKFGLFKLDSLSDKLLALEPTSVDDETGEMTYDINYQEEYIFKATETVEGYDPVEPITIKVMGSLNDDGEVDESLKIKTLDSNSFTDSTIEDIGKLVEPKLTPVEPVIEPENASEDAENKSATEPGADTENTQTSGDSSSTSNGGNSTSTNNMYYGTNTGTTEDGLVIKEKNIVALDAVNTSQTGETLARTGGFIGTIVGYLAAVALIVAGLFLVLGKEKRVK